MKKNTGRKKKKINVPNPSPVYVRLHYDEALQSKKNLLSAEMSILNIMKIIGRYNELRMEELRLKSEMYRAIKELDLSMKKTKASFPFLKIPERAKRQEIIKREINFDESKAGKKIFDEDLESQLKSIQDRLKSIGKNY